MNSLKKEELQLQVKIVKRSIAILAQWIFPLGQNVAAFFSQTWWVFVHQASIVHCSSSEKPLHGQRFEDVELVPFDACNVGVGLPFQGRRSPAAPSLTSRTPKWQLVVRSIFNGFNVGHCSRAKRSPPKCAIGA
eukprot:6384153-Amphidinium_carterae.1